MAVPEDAADATRKSGGETTSAADKQPGQPGLTQGTPSITRSIADAVVIKNENLFSLAKPDGCVPIEGNHGFGLYYHDCRYLSGYEIKAAGEELNESTHHSLKVGAQIS